MKPRDTTVSIRHFPADLLFASGIPIAVVAIAVSSLGSLLLLRGPEWIIAFSVSIAIALVGAVLIFRAKIPLYRKGIFWTVGLSDLPESSHSTYRWGIRISIIGCILAALLVFVSFLWR